MKLLILCPGKIAKSLDDVKCFTDVLNYYLPTSLSTIADSVVMQIPDVDDRQLKKLFSSIDVNGYDAIITLGLRFYSKISKETTALLRNRFNGIFCQVHDGSRSDHDPVDITFTFKNDDVRLATNPGWYFRHTKFNAYMGWASDPEINTPAQDSKQLRILVDHTNYGTNAVDKTEDVLEQIKNFIKSEIWKPQFESVSVRRFDSGKVVAVDFNNLKVEKYNRTAIPFNEITKEHCAAHIFCVTHPESVGLVVLETAMAGALPLVPKGFVPEDRLQTVRHLEWTNTIDWSTVLSRLDIAASRKKALNNTWAAAATRICNTLVDKIALKETIVNIVCLKWGNKYGPEYVNRLYAGVKRNTTINFKFWCFTDDATGIRPEVRTVPLPYATQLDSWWNKLHLFSNDIPIDQGAWIFYIDLDTLIVDNIDKLLASKHQCLVVLRDFYQGIVKSANQIGSGLMCWEHGKYEFIWSKFITNVEKHIKQAGTYGDQWWIEQRVKTVLLWQDLFPDQVVSFKVHCRKGIPANAKIICYHGKPSIPESSTNTNILGKWTIAPQPWVLKHWRERVEPVQVRYVELPAREIFGMVGRCGGGYNSLWEDWTPEGRQKRELIMQEYEEELNKICGHYSKLEASILAEGIRNPVVITCGYPKKRLTKHIPPEMLAGLDSNLLLLEGTTGGSRLHIAQKHDMTIPCFINDWTGRFSQQLEIKTEAQARAYYKDQPELVVVDPASGLLEGFDDARVSYHLGREWSEDKVMPLRAPMWISIMNKYGYQIDRLSTRVQDVLGAAGVDQLKNLNLPPK